ncbi:helix-turn-helix domain-containing protein [Brachybacterium sp. AOP43-C2-M15]|uniref:helix-turn-helix domain-containing protein n=1 Tax=Brachybacterium sp. AOP43-C2-M15 TaxID=3457661 RepID=UPI0040342A58
MHDARYERIESGDRHSWRMFHRTDQFGYMWHFHPEYEITVIVEGAGTLYVGDAIEEFEVGDLVLVGPNLPHTFVSDGPAASLCCQFGGDLLGEGWTERPEFVEIARLLDRSGRGMLFRVDDLEQWWSTYRSGPALRTHGLLGHLISLADREDGHELSSLRYQPRLGRSMMTRLDAMLVHIDQHIGEPITLDDLAGVACLSPTATSRFFRQQTGRTITDFLNHTRIAAACRLLSGSDEPVGTIAWRCGFGNLAHFHRQFRRATGVTPGTYRRQPIRLPSSPPERQEESA